MKLYLLLVLMQLPPLPSGLQPEPIVLERQFVGATTVQVCQTEADRLAAMHRQLRAEDVTRFKARIQGGCTAVDGGAA